MRGRLGGGRHGAAGLSLMGFNLRSIGNGALRTFSDTRPVYGLLKLTFNLAGIFGASLAPYIATYLAKTYGLQYVGYYLLQRRS